MWWILWNTRKQICTLPQRLLRTIHIETKDWTFLTEERKREKDRPWFATSQTFEVGSSYNMNINCSLLY